MKRCLDCLRLVFISPEFALVVVVVACRFWWPAALEIIGQKMKGETDSAKYLFLLPIAVLATNFGLAWRILFPSESLKRAIQEWEEYHRLWDRVVFGLFETALASVVSLGCWFFKSELSHRTVGALLAVSIGIAVSCLCSFVLAALTIKRVADAFEPEK